MKSSNSNIQPSNNYQFKIILLGESGVGKTSILSCYMEEKFKSDRPCTINADFKIKSLKIDQSTSVKLTIWDTAGQERYKSLTKHYFKDAHGIILIYDVADRRSFEGLGTWLEEIKNNMLKDEVSIILVGNKIDLPFRNVTKEEGESFANKNDLMYLETSSKEGTNIEKIFEMISKEIISKKSIYDSNYSSPHESLRAVRGSRINQAKCC